MRRTALLLMLLGACKPTDDAASGSTKASEPVASDKPADAPSPAGEVANKPTEQADPRPSKPAKLDSGKARELRKQYAKLLDEGRTLTKADKLDEAMVKYHAALEIDPSNPTVLGELGWAQFKANALEDAQATTMHALRVTQTDSSRGMLLYNLGRIAEARSENEAAITYYRTSLEKRPGNATVQARLDALLAGQPVAAVRPGGLGRIGEGLANLDAVCKLILDEMCVDFGGNNDPDGNEFDRCHCESQLDEEPPDSDDWGLMKLRIGEGFQEVWFPAVQTSAGWVVFDQIAWAYNPGVAGIFEEVHWQPSQTDTLLPGAAQPQLVLTWKKDRSDSDMGVNEFEAEYHYATVVCAREGAQAWCTDPLVQSDSYTRDVEFPVEEEEEPIQHEGLPITKEYSATFEWRDGKLIVSNVARKGDPGEQLEAGEYPLTGLLGK